VTYPATWPGTAIIKTQHNAFNWQGKPSQVFARDPGLFKYGTHSENGVRHRASDIAPKLSPQQKVAAELKRQRHGGQYSKAVASK